jgi:hypothetical protein
MTTFVKLVDREQAGNEKIQLRDLGRRSAGTIFVKAVSNLSRPSSAPSNRAIFDDQFNRLAEVPRRLGVLGYFA